MGWWDGHLPEIKKLVDEGVVYGEIAKRFNVTRNAVSGIVHREKMQASRQDRATAQKPRLERLQANPTPVKNARTLVQRIEAAAQPTPGPKPPQPTTLSTPRGVPPSRRLKLLDLGPYKIECRWPTGGEREHTEFCGHPTGGMVYCRHHMRAAHGI